MDIVLGAAGRVGTALVKRLLAKGRTVRAVVRDIPKATRLREMGASLAAADFGDAGAMRSAFAGGDAIFILTAEEPGSQDGLKETAAFLHVCRDAVRAADARRIVGLSSAGARHETGTGFLMTSVGFSSANARHMADMTVATIAGLTAFEGAAISLPTPFIEYARRHIADESL